MHARSRSTALPLAGFGLLALGVYATAFTIAASPLLARAPRLGPAAITFDLLVTVPLAFWWLVIRPQKMSPLVIIPLVIASGYAGMLVLPPDGRTYLHLARFVIAPAELWLLGYGSLRAWRMVRSGAHPRGDVPAAIRAALGELVRHPRVADVVAAEVALFWYALLSWRARPAEVAGETRFTQHRKSGIAGLLGALSGACVVEAVAVHLLVEGWSTEAAWTLTAFSVYGVVWLVGLARSIVLRPTAVTADGGHVRIGMMWEAMVPFSAVSAVTELRGGAIDRRAPGYLHATLIAAPRLMIDLAAPVEARGLYGNRKRAITRIGLLVDEPRALAALIRERAGIAG